MLPLPVPLMWVLRVSRGLSISNVTIMDYKGWALFCDDDVIFLEDVQNLFNLVDDKYAVMCVQHEYKPKPGSKMDGRVQT
ncbi:MAG: hypothetical protein MUQ11_00855, partial [Burkholderiaceae bacterium]|nr:hypothetical protein [Burkholderiaceae bacterium]